MSRHEPIAQPAVAQPTVASPTPAAPPESVGVDQTAAAPVRATNTIRILPPKSSTESQPVAATEMEPDTENSSPVLRLTVGDDRKLNADEVGDGPAEEAGTEQLASKLRAADRDEAAEEGPLDEPSAAAIEPVSAAAAESADYAFAPDYAWLRGRLEYSQSLAQWKLRYIPIDGKTDQFGGSVVLPNSPALEAFKPGDRVAVRGSLAARVFRLRQLLAPLQVRSGPALIARLNRRPWVPRPFLEAIQPRAVTYNRESRLLRFVFAEWRGAGGSLQAGFFSARARVNVMGNRM